MRWDHCLVHLVPHKIWTGTACKACRSLAVASTLMSACAHNVMNSSTCWGPYKYADWQRFLAYLVPTCQTINFKLWLYNTSWSSTLSLSDCTVFFIRLSKCILRVLLNSLEPSFKNHGLTSGRVLGQSHGLNTSKVQCHFDFLEGELISNQQLWLWVVDCAVIVVSLLYMTHARRRQ